MYFLQDSSNSFFEYTTYFLFKKLYFKRFVIEKEQLPPFEAYVLGVAVPARFVVHLGLVIPLPV